ncbi:MAG: hypothetical protein AAF383_19110, partial [Cyanobacteria bacterium P01_A01_bin.83]
MYPKLVNNICIAIANLRQLVRVEVQHTWHDLKTEQLAVVNEKNYIVFAKGKQIQWLGQKIIIPQTVQNYPISGLCL